MKGNGDQPPSTTTPVEPSKLSANIDKFNRIREELSLHRSQMIESNQSMTDITPDQIEIKTSNSKRFSMIIKFPK